MSAKGSGPDELDWLKRWWTETGRPLILGGALGFVLAMVAVGVLEALGYPVEGAGEPAWSDSVVALSFFLGWAGIGGYLRWRATGGVLPKRRVRQAAARGVDSTLAGQVARIEEKARRLRREARRLAPYRDLAAQAPELVSQARKLAGHVTRLQAAIAGIALDRQGPDLPATPPELPETRELEAEYAAAQEAQKRLDELVAANVAQQQLCLTRLERIEDLLEGALLEVSRPVGLNTGAATGTRATVVDDLEEELRAAREAVTEVEGREG